MRYLAGVLVAVLASIPLVAGEFSGLLTSDLRIELSSAPNLRVAEFDADLDIDYAVRGLTLGATAIVDRSQLEYVLFDAWGRAGAFWFTSYLQFGGPGEGDEFDFDVFATIAGLSIGSIDLFAAGAIDTGFYLVNDGVPHFAWTFGAAGAIGRCRIGLQAGFGLEIIYYGPDYENAAWSEFVLASTIWPDAESTCTFYRYGDRFPFAFKVCDDWSVGPQIWADPLTLETCETCLSELTLFVDVPLGCLRPLIVIDYFYYAFHDESLLAAYVYLYDLDLGIPFLELDTLEIYFVPSGKEIIKSEWGLLVGDVLCIEPWFAIDAGEDGEEHGPSFDGVELKGLSLELAATGIAFKVGTSFDPTSPSSFDRYGNRDRHWFPRPDCAPHVCEAMFGYDEYVAFIIDGESCCGGGFGLSIFSWFDVDDDNPWGDDAGIFGWEELRIEGYLDIGTNATLTGSLSILNEGLNWMQVGLDVAF